MIKSFVTGMLLVTSLLAGPSCLNDVDEQSTDDSLSVDEQSIDGASSTTEQDGLTVEGDELLSPSDNNVGSSDDGEEAEALEAEARVDPNFKYVLKTGYDLGRAYFRPYDEILEVCDRNMRDPYGVVVYYHTSNKRTPTHFLHTGTRECKGLNLDIPESGWIQMHVCLLDGTGAFGCSESKRFSAGNR